MKYLFMICVAESAGEAVEAADADPTAWVEEMERRGARVIGDRLAPVADARVVRVTGGGLSVTDGPFAETKEQIGGFDVIECADLDEAVEIASKHPAARIGSIEIRPFWTE